MAPPLLHRDIIAIGASAGGFEALRTVLHGLPANLPAAVFLVMHVGEVSQLADLLDRAGPLAVERAKAGARFEKGHVYVAPPGRHLLLHGDHMLLRRGPRENLARPAIDPLFRSAAATAASRVVGVVLSGALSDGTAGLRAIKRCGGVAVVQEPYDALVPSMPLSAVRHVDVDHVVPVARMADLLSRLAREPAGRSPEIPLDIRLEAAIAAQELADMKVDDMLGVPSRFTCPECHGALWEIEDGEILRYRCHVGHAFAADTVLASQSEEIDRLLGTLLRSHQERAALTWRMAEKERTGGHSRLAKQLERRAIEYDDDVQLMQRLLRDGALAGAAEGDVATAGMLRSALTSEEEKST
jgi:two-component system chemotaxis response regulator CheB